MNQASPSKNSYDVIVRSPKGQTLGDALQIWDFRYLIWTLIWRDLKTRYRHTTLGVLWFVLQPLILMLVISVGLRFVISGDVEGLPYPLYVASGLVLWMYFANGFPAGSTSLETYRSMINKVSFPHSCLPMIPAITAAVDMLAAGVLLIPMFIFYEMVPSWRVVFVPLIMLGTGFFVYGLSLFASASSARYKDLRHVIPFLSQLMFFASPVFISHAGLQGKTATFFMLNPFATYLGAFRWALFPNSALPSAQAIMIAAAGTLALLLLGLVYFQRQQSTLADIL